VEKMINKRNIISAAVLLSLISGFTAAEANSNNLLQMDVKRASTANTVDVTFYTTGDSTNSVVTRKSNNRYVVLLPNVSGSNSIVPGLGGVKDLITDVDVKHVNDGLGGYTKVTFGTTQPVNIKTYMKKTAPLTQEQKDYKNLIAQNNKPATQSQPKIEQPAPKQSTAKPTVQSTPKQPVQQKPQTTQTAKPKTTQPVQTPTAKVSILPKISFTPITPPKAKIEQPKKINNVVQPKVQPKIAEPKENVTIPSMLAQSTDNYVPKMKFDENGKRHIDLEPRINHATQNDETVNNQSTEVSTTAIPDVTMPENEMQTQEQPFALETPPTEEKSRGFKFPLWILAGGGTLFGLIVLFLVLDAVSHSSKKDSDRLKSFFNLSSKNQAIRRRREYNDIINDETLNWQEKYKKYTEKDKELHPVRTSDFSYVTDMSASKKAIVTPDNNKISNSGKNSLSNKSTGAFDGLKDSIKNIPADKEKMNEKLRAKIAQMEHSLAQTRQEEPNEVSDKVKSEDDAITTSISDVKLKSFAKSVSLHETNRTLLSEEKKQPKLKASKEGRFVKLKSSPLNVSKRKSASTDLNVSNTSDNIYLSNNNGEMEMNTQNENYSLTSVDEYMSILDTEEKNRVIRAKKDAIADTLAQVRPSTETKRSATNPISRTSNPMLKSKTNSNQYMKGLIVKSGYNIDSDKGFYIVNIDGTSALVGRIKDNVFVLKKFNYIVDKPLQVRLDYGSVYIVKVAGFKCLVEVSDEKMGTLVEI